jgi:hypothetical protein
MRTALTHARDGICLFGAVALVLYFTLVPHRVPAGGGTEHPRSGLNLAEGAPAAGVTP